MRLWTIGQGPSNDSIQGFSLQVCIYAGTLVYYLIDSSPWHEHFSSIPKHAPVCWRKQPRKARTEAYSLSHRRRAQTPPAQASSSYCPTTTQTPPRRGKSQIPRPVCGCTRPVLPLLHSLRSLFILSHACIPHCPNVDKSLLPRNCLSLECQIHCVVFWGWEPRRDWSEASDPALPQFPMNILVLFLLWYPGTTTSPLLLVFASPRLSALILTASVPPCPWKVSVTFSPAGQVYCRAYAPWVSKGHRPGASSYSWHRTWPEKPKPSSSTPHALG